MCRAPRKGGPSASGQELEMSCWIRQGWNHGQHRPPRDRSRPPARRLHRGRGARRHPPRRPPPGGDAHRPGDGRHRQDDALADVPDGGGPARRALPLRHPVAVEAATGADRPLARLVAGRDHDPRADPGRRRGADLRPADGAGHPGRRATRGLPGRGGRGRAGPPPSRRGRLGHRHPDPRRQPAALSRRGRDAPANLRRAGMHGHLPRRPPGGDAAGVAARRRAAPALRVRDPPATGAITT